MMLTLPPKSQAALASKAAERGVSDETLAVEILSRVLAPVELVQPIDEWERRLFGEAIDCGISVPDWGISSEGLQD